MRSKPALWYEARLIAGAATLLPLLFLPIYALVVWYGWHRGQEPVLHDLVQGFEVVLPLAAGLACAPLMLLEREEQFDLLRSTYPEPRWRLPLHRTLGALALALLTTLAGAIIFRLGYGPFALTETLLPAVPPVLLMVGFSLLVSTVTGSYWVTAGAVMAWWFFEFISRGYYTGLLYLFAETWPRLRPDFDLQTNRQFLAGLGALLLLLNGSIAAAWRKKGASG